MPTHAFLLRAINVGGTAKLPMGDLRALESVIETRFGFFREVIARDAAAIRQARDAHPFTVTNPAFSYVLFLDGAPRDDRIEAARRIPTGGDVWQVEGADLHLRYENGAGRPELNTDALLRALGAIGTARNLRSVDALIARMT